MQVSQEETYSATINYNDTGTVVYSWGFGDGSPLGTGKSVKHIYTSKVSYSVVLTLSEGKGNTDEVDVTVSTVENEISKRRLYKFS